MHQAATQASLPRRKGCSVFTQEICSSKSSTACLKRGCSFPRSDALAELSLQMRKLTLDFASRKSPVEGQRDERYESAQSDSRDKG